MNIFAGNITFTKAPEIPELDLDIIKTSPKTYFVMGADESINSSQEVIEYLEQQIGEIEFYDISIESEDMLEIISPEYEGEVYECVSFEGSNLSFEDILERFADSGEAVCVREAEASQKFNTRKIKVDFLY